jgi:hypothetical protein|tara:strand:+ start:92 stop:460 length:369 start_codon:yes stop_codon:yes gene_type:complete
MSKSPLNFGMFGAATIASGMTGAGRPKNLKEMLRGEPTMQDLSNKLDGISEAIGSNNASSLDPIESGTQAPMYETSVQGPVADNMVQNDPTNFNPNTVNAANQMFGEQMPGSFDRNMGNKIY